MLYIAHIHSCAYVPYRSVLSVCTKTPILLPTRKWITDKTAGKLETVLRVNKASAKVFEPRTSWNNYILIYVLSFREFFYRKSCVRALVVSVYYQQLPRFLQTSEFLNIHLLDLDGHKTRRTTSVPSYLLYFLFKSVTFAPDGICGVHKKLKFWLHSSPAVRIDSI